MTERIKLLHEQAEREFRGESFNGHTLMETCRSLSVKDAARTDTYENYSAWDNLIHCIYYKYVILRFLGAESKVPAYSWEEKSFPPITDTSEKAWKAALDYAEKVHDALQAQIAGLDAKRLDERYEAWDCTLDAALSWLPTHDTYHTAQIRNMGLACLRKPKK